MSAAASRQKPDVGKQKTEVTGQKTEHKRLKTDAVKKVAAAGKQMAGDKSRKIEVREQRAETISHQRSRPSTPLKKTTKGKTRKAEIKAQKREVTN